jgi:hypothetical protein
VAGLLGVAQAAAEAVAAAVLVETSAGVLGESDGLQAAADQAAMAAKQT